jgi:CRISPR-associated endonuclease/helicase Cas3
VAATPLPAYDQLGALMSVNAEFWGKARPSNDGGIGFHPLIAHSLDVAAVAILLQDGRIQSIDPRMLGFLVSLHDIGKISHPFQAKARAYWPSVILGPYPSEQLSGPAHDAVGVSILTHALSEQFDDVLPGRSAGRQPGWKRSDRNHLWRALAGHHGRPPAIADRLTAKVFCAACQNAAVHFVETMKAVFQPQVWPGQTDQDVIRLSWRVAGLTTLADWVGSRQAWFPYVTTADVADPARYFWGHALPHAAAALAAAGLMASSPAPFAGLRGLFPGITLPSPIQQWAETVPLPEGPVLTVIEDLTGSGKTEAALTLAHRLLAKRQAQGIYLALPTMATANAMFDRLATAYRGLFAPEAHPSLALAHRRAALNAHFVAAIEGDGSHAPRTADPADEPAEAHCTAWLAQDRRRALLAQVGVGTLDQALLAVLPVRHAALRLQGLAGKVLIVDEVHAFDPYMRQELATLLRFHAELGGSAVLLSATLPQKLRAMLIGAFQNGLGVPAAALLDQAYPLATIAGADCVTETPCRPRSGLPRRVTITRLPDATAAVARIVPAAQAGAAVAWVRNTVDDAIEAMALLRAAGIEPLLFHARFAMADRLAIEGEVLRCFGRSSAGTQRQRVLVATQVIEQSLDIDFDLMVTDLAPADLLIQRAGRLWRHGDRDGQRCVGGPTLLIVSPVPVDDPDANWIKAALPGTSFVYSDHALLWRSAREVFRRGAIVSPDDMRPIIETVFDRSAIGAVPLGLATSDQQAHGKGLGQAGIAAQNVLDFRQGYSVGEGLWDPDTKTPTRLEERPQVTLRLARLRDGVIMPYADDSDVLVAWAQSEVSVPQYRIAACPVPVELEAAAEEAQSHWGRWERDSPVVLLALLHPDGDGYRLEARAEFGSIVAVRYDARTGLSWLEDKPAFAG